MPAENTGNGFVRRVNNGDCEEIVAHWETNSSGVFRKYIGPIYGTLERIESLHATASATGTYSVKIQDFIEADLLDGQIATAAVNTTTVLATVEDDTRTSMESRPTKAVGPSWLIITASTSAVHTGVLVIRVRKG